MNPLAAWTTIFSVIHTLPDVAVEGPGRRLGGTATVSLDPPYIPHQGDVIISISDPTLPGSPYCNKTYIALYSPVDANINTTVPIRYQSLLDNPSFCSIGSGTLRFNLGNLHTGGYTAYLIQAQGLTLLNDSDPLQYTWIKPSSKPFVGLAGLKPGNNLAGVVLGQSNNVQFSNPNEPTHVRITTGVGEGNYVVSWNQMDDSTGGVLRWSMDPQQTFSQGGNAVAGSSWTITLDDVCQQGPSSTVGFRTLGTQWSVNLTLAAYAGETIYYAVGDSQMGSRTFSFNIPLLPGQYNESFRQKWILLADHGVGYDPSTDDSYNGRNINNGHGSWQVGQGVKNQVEGDLFQAVLISGDIAYSDGYLGQTEDYLDMIQPFASLVPLLTNVGNHESDWYSNTPALNYSSPDGSVPTADFWNLNASWNGNGPANSISSGGECGVSTKIWPQSNSTVTQPWYTYSAGLLTIVVFSTEHDMRPGSVQYAWLNATLMAVNRTLTPWLVVTGHRPMYSPQTPYLDAVLIIQSIEPLLTQYNVNVYFSGHLHMGARSCPMIASNCVGSSSLGADNYSEYTNPTAPIYYLVGASGATFDPAPSPPNWTEWKMTNTFFYSIFEVVSPTVLEITFWQPDQFGSGVGVVKDKSRIIIPGPSMAPTVAPTVAPTINPSTLLVAEILVPIAGALWIAGLIWFIVWLRRRNANGAQVQKLAETA